MKRSLFSLAFLVLAAGALVSGCGDGEPDASGDGDGDGTGGTGDGDGDGTGGTGDGDGDGTGGTGLGGSGGGEGGLTCRDNQEICDDFCASVNSDPENCGECGNVCEEGDACLAGECGYFGCGPGLVTCDGICQDLQTSNENCGACGDPCASGERCDNGVCQTSCPEGYLTCDAECVNPQNDSNYCGAASCDDVGAGGAGGNGEVCASGQICTNGTCELSCPVGYLTCDGECIDPTKDRDYCGATSCDDVGTGGNGEVCEAAQICSSGACAASCPIEQIVCGDTCVDPLNDRDYCGATDCSAPETSGAQCLIDESCVVGECREYQRVWSQGDVASVPPFSTGTNGQSMDVDDSGNAMVIWREYTDAAKTDAGLRLFSRRFAAATKTWGPVARVDDGDIRINERIVTVAPDGSATAIWVPNTTPTSLRMARYDLASNTWSASTRVDSFDSAVISPVAVVGGLGNVHIAWIQTPPAQIRGRIFYSRFDASSQALTAPMEFSGYGEDDACTASFNPALVVNDAGDAALGFYEFQQANYCPPAPTSARNFVSIYDMNAETWSVPSLLDTPAGMRPRNPSVAMDAAGNVYAAWAGFDATLSRDTVYANRYTVGGGWGTIVPVKTYPGTTSGTTIVTAPLGASAITTYHRPAGSGTPYDIEAHLRDATLAVRSTQLLQTGIVVAPVPKSTISPTGSVFINWTNGSNVEVSQWNELLDVWLGPTVLNVGLSGTATDAQVAVSVRGQAYATWHQTDAGFSSLYFARYD